jgi:hypothetical protein
LSHGLLWWGLGVWFKDRVQVETTGLGV